MSDRHTAGQRFLAFSLGKDEYAVPIDLVREVVAVPEFTPVPYAPAHYLGIMNLRGQILPAIDLRKKLSLAPGKTGEEAIIIVEFAGAGVGFLVDSVNSVILPKAGEVSDKPGLESSGKGIDYFTGVYRRDEQLVLLIDPRRLVDGADRMLAANKAA